MVETLDDGRRVNRGGTPLRTCVVTRAERSPAELIRFVLDPSGRVVPDIAARLPGRGAWVTCSRAAVAEAVRTRAFSRSFKRDVSVPADLADVVVELLVKRAGGQLAMANKAGLVVAGFAKVDNAIAAGTPIALIHGRNASDDGVEKLDRRFNAMCRDAGRPVQIVDELTIEQISLALGRANVVHAALMMGGSADLFLAAAGRLDAFEAGSVAGSSDRNA